MSKFGGLRENLRGDALVGLTVEISNLVEVVANAYLID